MSVARRKVHAAAAAVLAAVVCLSGCGIDLGEVVSDKISEEVGEEVDITLGAGPTCLPGWVNFPEMDSANQGMRVPGGQVCVSSWFIDEADGFDANQSLPEVADEGDLAALGDALLPLLLSQVPGAARDALTGSAEYGEMVDALNDLDITFRAYGEGQRLILLLVADGEDVADHQLVIGAFCEGTC